MFFFFSRAILFPDARLRVAHLLHLAPIPLAFFAPRELATPLAFSIGTAYCLWITGIVYRLREHRRRFRFELFFFGLFSVLAILILVLGFSSSYIDNAYFYYFYANGIALAFVLVTGALIAFPELLRELHEVVRLNYSNSTLERVDIPAYIEKLEHLMETEKLFQNENLDLSTAAQILGLSSHQLSELINRHYGVGFPKYVRAKRVKEAEKLLVNEPEASVLSIGLEVGFKSQSNFYAAFKECHGQSPGAYRQSASSASVTVPPL